MALDWLVHLGGGLDPAKALKRLSAVGVSEVWQAALYLPVRHLDARSPIDRFFGISPGLAEAVCIGRFDGDFRTRWVPTRGRRSSPQATGRLVDRQGLRLRFSVFGESRGLQKALEAAEGNDVALAGTLNLTTTGVFLSNPVLVDPPLIGHMVPVYPGKPRVLSTEMARRAIATLLPAAIPDAAGQIRPAALAAAGDQDLRRLVRWSEGSLEELLWRAHVPSDPADAQAAMGSLERLSALVTIGELRRFQHEQHPPRMPIAIDSWHDLLQRIPFELTSEQHEAVERLVERLRSGIVSSTLINADVGMGKSVIYQLAAAAAVRAGARVAVLLPNERLAEQAYSDIQHLFPELRAELVTSRRRKASVSSRWLVGTTALLFRDVGPLDVCVVDEQHRFSVEQRRSLAHAGTHVIEISATPIPRTQALLLYGKVDVIRLTQRHSAQAITTRVVQRSGTDAMVHDIHAVVGRGARVLIICPRREDAEDDEDPLPSVARVAAKWERLFPGRVRAIHGETDAEEVGAAFADLAAGRAQIMVATTVVEVGLNIANLRAMIIVHAERFGVSQLHQLRGRLAREGGAGVCYLYLPRSVGIDAMSRLDAVARTQDGFELAEFDMRHRGIGDVSSTGQRQHGATGSLLLTRGVPMETFLEVLSEVSQ